jgi:hypothetical protein
MEYLIIPVVAFIVSGLTLVSGFVSLAIAATAVVHLANNVFKLVLVGRHADWRTVIRFGAPAAVAGAGVLSVVAGQPPSPSTGLGGRDFQVTAVKLRTVRLAVATMLLGVGAGLVTGLV